VSVDGQLVFSKNRDHAFPSEAAVVQRLKEMAG
jgi:hypothetical protein